MSNERPQDQVDWAESPEADTSEPTNERKRGWPFGSTPPADQKNWLQRMVGRWLDYLRSSSSSVSEVSDSMSETEHRTITLENNGPTLGVLDEVEVADRYIVRPGATATNGRRFFAAPSPETLDSAELRSFRLADGQIQQSVIHSYDSAIEYVSELRTDGRVVVADGTEQGTTDTPILVEVTGDAEFTIDTSEDSSTAVDCDGEFVYTVQGKTDPTYEIFVAGYDIDTADGANPAPTFTTDIVPSLPAGTWDVRSCRSNGQFLAILLRDGTDYICVFYDIDEQDILFTFTLDIGLTGFGTAQMEWMGDELFVAGSNSAQPANLERLSTAGQKSWDLIGSEGLSGLSTDGDFLYAYSQDNNRLYKIDPHRGSGTSDDDLIVHEEFVPEVDIQASVCDGLVLWYFETDDPASVDGTNFQVRYTGRQSRDFIKVDTSDRHRKPFHHTMIPRD